MLSLGLNFAVSQDYIPKTEILANIEKGIKNLSDTSSIIRSKVVNIYNKKNKSIPNLSIKERKALKNLRNDTNIVITKADKGNCTVIIDKDKYEEKKINDNDLMLSFDVVSLFTKIPVHIAKSVIFDRLKCDSELKFRCKLNVNEIMNALDLCSNNTYLCFRKKFDRQIFGVAMGSPISVIVANLVMESIENKMLKDFASPPRIILMILLLC